MAYNYKITRLQKKLEDEVVVSYVIGVICEKVVDSEVVDKSYLDWEVSTTEFDPYPPDSTSLIDYVVSYLNEEVGGVSRKQSLQNEVDEPVITFEEDSTLSEDDKDLNL